jgi:hypothetical protein
MKMDIIIIKVFFLPYVSDTFPAMGAITAAVIRHPQGIHEEVP